MAHWGGHHVVGPLGGGHGAPIGGNAQTVREIPRLNSTFVDSSSGVIQYEYLTGQNKYLVINVTNMLKETDKFSVAVLGSKGGVMTQTFRDTNSGHFLLESNPVESYTVIVFTDVQGTDSILDVMSNNHYTYIPSYSSQNKDVKNNVPEPNCQPKRITITNNENLEELMKQYEDERSRLPVQGL